MFLQLRSVSHELITHTSDFLSDPSTWVDLRGILNFESVSNWPVLLAPGLIHGCFSPSHCMVILVAQVKSLVFGFLSLLDIPHLSQLSPCSAFDYVPHLPPSHLPVYSHCRRLSALDLIAGSIFHSAARGAYSYVYRYVCVLHLYVM